MDDLDTRLLDAAPHTGLAASEEQRRSLVRGARRAARRRTRARALLGAGLAVVLVGGGATTFANEGVREWLMPEVQDPYVTYRYTAPSGAVCTATSGDVIASDPAAADALRDWLSTADILDLVDIDVALAQLRSYYTEDEMSKVGTDSEYSMAMGIAVVLAARAELAERGFPHGSIDEWKTNEDCTEPAS